jgi:hypothetical protein
LAWCCRWVGNRADMFRRARWPAYGPKHFLTFHMSVASGLNSGQFNRERN